METKNNLKAWLYLAPLLLLMGLFTFYPLVNAFIISIYKDYQPLANGGAGQASGFTLMNFVFVIKNQLFLDSLKNTFVIAFISVPVSIFISLFISVALKNIPKLKGFFQTIYFLPYVTNAIAIGMAFAFMFHTNYGLFNVILGWFGIDAVNWIGGTSSWWAQMGALLVFTVWSGLAFKILVFTSGMQNIDKQYYDAAKIDSASKWTVFRRITVPLLSPLILYISITSMIGALKAYNSIIGLFGTQMGAQPYSMMTIVAFVYRYVSGYTDIGYISYASAAAIILFVITVIFSLIQGVVSRKRVHY
ncbi:MAG: sugar ABC transporter permease [Candidatus Izemoplasmatales bacterium]|jgi:multiple sugar transport system permease protein|nr:sugar ABC transporter permease [Candidatus Izemoplasmatales bacterium]